MMKATIRGLLLAMASAGLVAGCGGNQSDPEVPTAEAPVTPSETMATLAVENQSSDAMTIYAWRSGTRMRLGTVSPGQTQKFALAKTMFLGTTTLRVEADPMGRERNKISEEFSLREGDEIVLRIPPI
jgi:hypothetical protein